LQRNPWRITYKYLLRHTALGTLTPIYDRDAIGEFFFDESLSARMDWVFWLDVLREGHIAYRFDRDLARYRRGHSSLSSNINKGRKIVWDILRYRQEVPYPKIFWYYASYIFHAGKKRRLF
jgi:teichuronic acid biosynthesis glycosyltransferase TuaG